MKRKIPVIVIMVLAICLAIAVSSAEGYTTVDEAVTGIVAEMNAAGITGEYEQAVWLHDWLTGHANYDYSYQWYTPDGVLLYGKGVCESYTSAYALLLSEAGIENTTIVSDEMEHTWNLVKLEEEWCHVDVTWDDPDNGGAENHFSFGMNDRLISRDHKIETSAHVCTTTDNYYPFRYDTGVLLLASRQDLIELLETAIQNSPETISLYYIGNDPSFSVVDEFISWANSVNYQYGILGYTASYGNYRATFQIQYTDPWVKMDTDLEEPVDAPSFSMAGPAGTYRLSNYSGNGLVLIFGRKTCSNTRAVLQGLRSELESLNSVGVEVLVSVIDSEDVEDILAMEELHPGYPYVYDYSNVLWNSLNAVGYDIHQSVTFPCIFLINSSGQIVSYSTGSVNNMTNLIAKAFSLGTGKKLPKPEPSDPLAIANGSGNVNELTGSTMVAEIQSALAGGNYVIFLSNRSIDYNNTRSFLASWEKRSRLYDALGMKMVVSLENISDEIPTTYPHVTFVDYSNPDFWQLLVSAGYDGSSASTLSNFFYAPDGRCIAYSNGSTLSLNDCALLTVEGISYDMSVPDDLAEIQAEAFARSDFRSVDLTTGSLKTIGAGAFADCDGLRLVRIPGTVTEIGDNAFSGCDNDVILICPGNSEACRYAIRNGFLYLSK